MEYYQSYQKYTYMNNILCTNKYHLKQPDP